MKIARYHAMDSNITVIMEFSEDSDKYRTSFIRISDPVEVDFIERDRNEYADQLQGYKKLQLERLRQQIQELEN